MSISLSRPTEILTPRLEGEHRSWIRLFDPLLAKQPANVLGAVHHPQDLDAVVERPVEDEYLLEARDTKQPQATQLWKLKLGIPSHVGLSREE